MENIYFNCILIKKIVVPSKFLNKNFNDYIYLQLKEKIENKCIDEGYVEENSIKIINKSVGKLLNSQFTGDITFEIVYTANICNPMIGNIIDCKVKFINKLGILGNNGPIDIVIGKEFHTNTNVFNKIKEGQNIKVQVIGKNFTLNSSKIIVTAKLWNIEELNKKEFILNSDLTPINDNDEYMNNEYEDDVDNVDNVDDVDDNNDDDNDGNDNDGNDEDDDEVISLNDLKFDDEIQKDDEEEDINEEDDEEDDEDNDENDDGNNDKEDDEDDEENEDDEEEYNNNDDDNL
jgi:DNA-directed RNA polymerase subunit E'/Rpb7